MRVWLDLEAAGEIPGAWRMSAGAVMAASGANLGNLAFRHALRTVVADLDGWRPMTGGGLRRAGRDVERVLISCANWLGTTPADEAANAARARVLEAVDAPLVPLGLGVQAPLGAESVALGPETVRLARLLSARSAAVSVRDDLTARTLAGLGITNAVVTGCPSGFIAPERDLGARVAARAEASRGRRWREVRTALSEHAEGHPRAREVLGEELRLMRDTAAFTVLQSPALLPFLLREREDVPAHYAGHEPVLRAKALHFSSVESWLDFCRTCDLATGMRIHGTVVPLQAGVPSLLVAHDARVAGLAARMGVPAVAPGTWLDLVRRAPAALFEAIAARMAGYDDNRRALAATLRDVLEANGVPAHPSLRALAA